MKKYKDLNQYDFSGYAEEISGDALFLINGGAEIENSNKGVANAKPGDTLTRNDGTTVTITQGDIDWAKKQVGESETTATDVKSYENFINGNNTYDVCCITSNVNAKKTSKAIIDSIDSKTSYFLIDHIFDINGKENCNTALFNTIRY